MIVAIFVSSLATIEAQNGHLLRDIVAFRLQPSSCKRRRESGTHVKFSSKLNIANTISQFKLI
jgi:hypothetical protein